MALVHHAARRRSRVAARGARAAKRAHTAHRRSDGDQGNRSGTPLRAMAFRQALAKLGWSEGRNVVIDFRFGTGDLNWFRAQAKELTGVTPDVIVAESTPAALALRHGTSTVPIVFLHVANPIGRSLVPIRARPGPHLTGFTNLQPARACR